MKMNDPMAMMREQMDELMGKHRDVALSERSEDQSTNFKDPSLDRYYLCGCSPYDLLRGTKCETMPQLERDGFLKERSEGVRMQWEVLAQEEKDKYGFERDLYDLLSALIDEQDKRIVRLKERYDRENAEEATIPPDVQKEIDEMKEQVRARTRRGSRRRHAPPPLCRDCPLVPRLALSPRTPPSPSRSRVRAGGAEG